MGRRKKVYSVNFNSLNDMILYAYGKEKKINNKKDTERLLFEIKERILSVGLPASRYGDEKNEGSAVADGRMVKKI
ncbi:MAG: hypothetical protein IJ749_06640 [Eubacterium sp.]|nr:hypothetical protein [Eubacterium sp.]